MSLKTYFQQHPVLFVLFNIVLAALVALIIAVCVFNSLKGITHHGEEVEVPDISGMYIDEAGIILESQELGYTIVDSIYDKSRKLGTVVQQVPVAGSHVKKNREIYLIVNAKQVRTITVPDLRNFSYRQAKVQLEAAGLMVDTAYTESEYPNLVIDMEYKDRPIDSYTKVKEGETIKLIIGKGAESTIDYTMTIPDLLGLSLREATALIRNSDLALGGCHLDNGDLDTIHNTYWIYDQEPQAFIAARPGTTVSVYVTTNISKANENKQNREKEQENKASEEEFF